MGSVLGLPTLLLWRAANLAGEHSIEQTNFCCKLQTNSLITGWMVGRRLVRGALWINSILPDWFHMARFVDYEDQAGR